MSASPDELRATGSTPSAARLPDAYLKQVQASVVLDEQEPVKQATPDRFSQALDDRGADRAMEARERTWHPNATHRPVPGARRSPPEPHRDVRKTPSRTSGNDIRTPHGLAGGERRL